MRLYPWFLALASSIPVLGLESVCPQKRCPWPRIFLCPWPWPRALCPRLHLWPRLSRGHEARGQGQGHRKNPRPRTALPRTEPLEAKDRNARGQGQGPRTQAQAFSKKKGLQKFFSGDLKKKSLQKICQALSSKKCHLKIFFQAIYKISKIQKIVLSSSRGQGNFRRLEASKPRPRTSKCVLEDVLKAKDVLEDSTSDNKFMKNLPKMQN